MGERVGKRAWVTALVLNVIVGLVGVLWAVLLTAVGGLMEAGALFGRGGGGAHYAAQGAALIGLAACVSAGPLLLGVGLAATRRRGPVITAYVVAGLAFVLPWCALLLR